MKHVWINPMFFAASLLLGFFAASHAFAEADAVDTAISDVKKKLHDIEASKVPSEPVATSAKAEEKKPHRKKVKKTRDKDKDKDKDKAPKAEASGTPRPEPVAKTAAPVATPDRAAAAEAPSALKWQFVSKYQFVHVSRSGSSPESFHLENVDAKFDLDLDAAMGWKGWRLRTYVLGNFGGAPSAVAGDAQGSSNIEAAGDFVKIYEAHVEKSFADGAFSVLAGLRDLNADFYANDAAGLFLNSSFGVGTELAHTGVNGPSIFPTTATAIVIKSSSQAGFYMNAGAFDAVAGDLKKPLQSHFHYDPADGVLSITEAGFSAAAPDDKLIAATKVAIGMWQYSHPVAQISDEAAQDVNYGSYGIVETALPLRSSLFVRHGFANPRVNIIASNTAWGFTKSGILKSNGGDVIGLAVTEAAFGQQWAETQQDDARLSAGNRETAIELTWRIPVIEHVTVQPDFQHIARPSGVKNQGGPVNVGSVRIDFEF